MRGVWRDNNVLTYGGNGYNVQPGAFPSDHAFPGDTDPLGYGTDGIPQAPWTEFSAGNTPGDGRALAIMGPGTLEPGEHIDLLVAYVYARATNGGPQASVTALQNRVDSVRTFVQGIDGMFDQGETTGLTCQPITTGIAGTSLSNTINLFPNPAVDHFTLRCTDLPSDAAMELYDMQGAQVIDARLTSAMTTINVSDLQAGIYTVRVLSAGMVMAFRLVKAE